MAKKQSWQHVVGLYDEDGNLKIELVFDLDYDYGHCVIESVEVRTWGDYQRFSGSQLTFWIGAAGGEEKLIQKYLAERSKDECRLAKAEREQKMNDGGAA